MDSCSSYLVGRITDSLSGHRVTVIMSRFIRPVFFKSATSRPLESLRNGDSQHDSQVIIYSRRFYLREKSRRCIHSGYRRAKDSRLSSISKGPGNRVSLRTVQCRTMDQLIRLPEFWPFCCRKETHFPIFQPA
jgi:hypothetical protein